MAGYYDEITGDWIELGGDAPGYEQLDATSGTGSMPDDWYDEFLQSIGINPATATGTGASPTNAQIEQSLGLASGTGIDKLLGQFKSLYSTNGALDLSKIVPLAAGLYGASRSNTRTVPTGYQGGIPKYTAVRNAPKAGEQLSGDVTYTKAAEGGHLQSGGFVIPADVVSHFGNGSSDAGLQVLAAKLGATPIKGRGDGMSDSIPTTIDGEQKALVAHEEAYVSPEKVARLGGGDSDKGAKKLRDMMDRIREARTGSAKQGKQIDPDKYMPGGEVKRYEAGGTTSSGVGSAAASGVTGTESNLSSWAGPYVTDLLGRGQALAATPYEAYKGPLTAGASDLQTKAFGAASGLTTPAAIGNAANTAGNLATSMQGLGYGPTQFSNQFTAPAAYDTGNFSAGLFDTDAAKQYMNPYLETALAPQLAELQRQNKIAEMGDMAKLTKAGAYGGSRQGVLQAENIRNLMDKVNQVTGQGYSTAYDKAMAQFNADQQRALDVQRAQEQSRQFGATQGLTAAQTAAQYGQSAADAAERSKQFGATFGLDADRAALAAAQAQGQLGALQSQTDVNNLQQLAALGATQRGISAEDIAAKKAAFEEARVNPYKMIQFEQSLLQGLPLAAQTYNMAPTSDLSQFASGASAMQKILDTLGIKS